MGAISYSSNIIVNVSMLDAFNGIKKILKKQFYPIQFENKEKNIIIARIEQKWLAPAGELIVFDLKEIETNKIEILIFSKDLLNSGVNFNRNVKNVEKFIQEINNQLTKK